MARMVTCWFAGAGVKYAVVSGPPQRIIRLVSEDAWASAVVDASVNNNKAATTFALAGD